MTDMADVHVIIPHGDGGVSVVGLLDLGLKLDEYGGDLERAVMDSAIDTADRDADVVDVVDPVRQLNATGDAERYWTVR